MSATHYRKPHVDIFICIEMARERNRVIKKNTRYILHQAAHMSHKHHNTRDSLFIKEWTIEASEEKDIENGI